MAELTTQGLLDGSNQRTDDLVAQLMQFFNDPARQGEISALPNAQADQAFNALSGQFEASSRNNAFDLAARGLTGGSQQQNRIGSLNRAYQGAAAGVEDRRQGQIFQGQMQLQNQYNSALGNAYQGNQYTQGGLNAINLAAQQNAQADVAGSNQGHIRDANSSASAVRYGQAVGNTINTFADNVRVGG